jgi:hypothetical protein
MWSSSVETLTSLDPNLTHNHCREDKAIELVEDSERSLQATNQWKTNEEVIEGSSIKKKAKR